MHRYLETAVEIAAAAGEIMLRYFDTGVSADTKGDDTPVTVADRAINQLVIDRISAEYPDHGVVGEEASLPRPGAPMQWVCDPIDGTMPFVLGIPTNVFGLALCEHGEPLVSVIADPYQARLYSAGLGEGSFCNGQELEVSTRTELSGALMNISGRGDSHPADGAAIEYSLERLGVRQMRHHSMLYEVVQVASGRFDAAAYTMSHPWDAAAGVLLVTEAGGTVTDLVGSQQRYDREIRGAVFSNGLLHDQLLSAIAPHLVHPA